MAEPILRCKNCQEELAEVGYAADVTEARKEWGTAYIGEFGGEVYADDHEADDSEWEDQLEWEIRAYSCPMCGVECSTLRELVEIYTGSAEQFNVGDQVWIMEEQDGRDLLIGTRGEVTEVDLDMVLVYFDDPADYGDSEWWFYNHQVSKGGPIKVGDTVKVLAPHDSLDQTGEVGTVDSVNATGMIHVITKQKTRGWWYPAEKLQKMEVMTASQVAVKAEASNTTAPAPAAEDPLASLLRELT